MDHPSDLSGVCGGEYRQDGDGGEEEMMYNLSFGISL